MNKITQIIQKYNGLNDTTISKSEYFLVQKRPMNDFTFFQRKYYNTKCTSKIPQNNLREISQELNQLPFENFLAIQLIIGDMMPKYEGLNQIFSDNKVDLFHKENQILILFFWSTWSQSSKHYLKIIQTSFKNNQIDWENKVRIVGLSVDESKQSIKKVIMPQNESLISYLALLGWKQDNKIIQNFQVKSIPSLVIVDSKGKINYIGSIDNLLFEQYVNQLIQDEQNKKMQKNVEKQELKQQHQILQQKQQSQKIKQSLFIIQELQKFNEIFSKSYVEQKYGQTELFSLNGKITVKMINGIIQVNKIALKVSTFVDTSELINLFKEDLKKFKILKTNKYELIENLVEFQPVPQLNNSRCVNCNQLLDFPYYWCKWDQTPNNFRCRQCVEKIPQQSAELEETKHFSYLNNCILITGPWKRIPIKGFGKNRQPKSIKDVKKPHQFECNSCQCRPSEIGIAKYICLACQADPNPRGDYTDFCGKCVNDYLKGNQQTILKMNIDGHRKQHPLLRILYNVQGYYKF